MRAFGRVTVCEQAAQQTRLSGSRCGARARFFEVSSLARTSPPGSSNRQMESSAACMGPLTRMPAPGLN